MRRRCRRSGTPPVRANRNAARPRLVFLAAVLPECTRSFGRRKRRSLRGRGRKCVEQVRHRELASPAHALLREAADVACRDDPGVAGQAVRCAAALRGTHRWRMLRAGSRRGRRRTAASSTSVARAVLTSTDCGFISREPPRIDDRTAVRWRRAVQRDYVGLREDPVDVEPSERPRQIEGSAGTDHSATIRAPMADVTCATCRPIAPQPRTPTVRPEISMPRRRGQPPALMPASQTGMWRSADEHQADGEFGDADGIGAFRRAARGCRGAGSSASGRLSMPTPLRLMTRRRSAAAPRGETGSTPASHPTHPGTSAISSASLGCSPGRVIDDLEALLVEQALDSSGGGVAVSERGVTRIRSTRSASCGSMAMREISSNGGPRSGCRCGTPRRSPASSHGGNRSSRPRSAAGAPPAARAPGRGRRGRRDS